MSRSPTIYATGRVRSFLSHPSQISAVRAFISSVTGGNDTAVLLGSELAANAVLHGRPLPRGVFTVAVTVTAAAVLVSVQDGGPRGQALIQRQPGESGRGLGMVAVLAARHGRNTTGSGSMAWFELAA